MRLIERVVSNVWYKTGSFGLRPVDTMDNTICEITLLLEAFILGLNRVCARVGLVQANANSEPGGQLDHFS